MAKDMREDIWTRFKNASTVINKKHQDHFEKLRANEEENLAKKTALCEKTEAVAKEDNKSAADWEKHSKEIIAIQQEWKTIGFAPKKSNEEIFQRFRKACDDFFGRKAEYFKEVRACLYENAEKKKALVAKAQELANSTDWKATSDKLIQLQKVEDDRHGSKEDKRPVVERLPHGLQPLLRRTQRRPCQRSRRGA